MFRFIRWLKPSVILRIAINVNPAGETVPSENFVATCIWIG